MSKKTEVSQPSSVFVPSNAGVHAIELGVRRRLRTFLEVEAAPSLRKNANLDKLVDQAWNAIKGSIPLPKAANKGVTLLSEAAAQASGRPVNL